VKASITSPDRRSREGFTLIEIVIALGIAGFCLVSMLGLIPTGMKSVKTSLQETTATEALAAIATDLRDTQPGSNTTPVYAIPIPSAISTTTSTNFYLTEAGALTTSNDFSAQFSVTATLSNSTTFLTTAHIQIYWPPGLQIQNAQGMVETTISFNRD